MTAYIITGAILLLGWAWIVYKRRLIADIHRAASRRAAARVMEGRPADDRAERLRSLTAAHNKSRLAAVVTVILALLAWAALVLIAAALLRWMGIL